MVFPKLERWELEGKAKFKRLLEKFLEAQGQKHCVNVWEVTFQPNGVVVLVFCESNSRTGSFKTGILEHAKRLRLHQTHTYIFP